MTKPLALSDAQMSAVLQACAPLAPHDRDAFIAALANLLRNEREIGDGTVHRAIRSLQREFWRPPTGMTKEVHPHRRHVGEPIP